MKEAAKNSYLRPRAETTQNFTSKSGIFERKNFDFKPIINPASVTLANSNQKFSSKTIPTSKQLPKNFNNFAPLKASELKNPTQNNMQKMFSSSLVQYEKQPFTGKLASMARHVSETQQDKVLENDEKQKNKFSFLKVPQTSIGKSDSNENTAMKGSWLNVEQKNIKSPSFLKKETKSSYDPEEKSAYYPCVSESKNSKQDKSQISSKHKCETDSKKMVSKSFLNQEKGPSFSPINSSDSQKKTENFLNPANIPNKSQRKSSLVISSSIFTQKQSYTPTEKKSFHTSSNFIPFKQDKKYQNNSGKNSNKSGFFENKFQKDCIIAKDTNQDLESASPLRKNGAKKVFVPEFIKMKEKRNQLFKKGTLNTQSSFDTNPTSTQFLTQRNKQWTLDHFQVKQRLGRGAFGDVFLARQAQTGFFCVLKKLSKKKIKEQKLEEHILREIKIQAYLQHKHLTSLYGFFDDQQYIYLIVQYLSDGSLAQKVNRKKLPEKQVASIIRQICQGLKFMHIQDIIHRDIKPENVFIHEDYIKIGDFGCSVCSNTKRNTVVGCLAYISPQQLNNQSYDDKIDVWSVGILAYELLTGRAPFEEDILKIARQQKQPKLSQLRFPSKLGLSQESKDFVRRLLEEVPQNRLTITEALKHPFVIKNGVKENILEQNLRLS